MQLVPAVRADETNQAIDQPVANGTLRILQFARLAASKKTLQNDKPWEQNLPPGGFQAIWRPLVEHRADAA